MTSLFLSIFLGLIYCICKSPAEQGLFIHALSSDCFIRDRDVKFTLCVISLIAASFLPEQHYTTVNHLRSDFLFPKSVQTVD